VQNNFVQKSFAENVGEIDTCSQFQPHSTSRFCANFRSPKYTNIKCKKSAKKKLSFNSYIQTHKMWIKMTTVHSQFH